MATFFKGRSHVFSVSVGKYDQVFTFGLKVKDGEEIDITEDAVSVMMANFANRKNDIGMDYEHATATAPATGAPAPQLAFYNALAMVVGGEVKSFVTHDDTVQPPADTTGMTDGLYAHRYCITPLGERLLPNYRFISPLFVMQDKNEAGEDIGPNLLNISAVSVPFQDGCEIQFGKLGAQAPEPGVNVNEEMKKALGLADDASDKECMAALTARLKKFEDAEAAMQKMAADKADAEKMAADKAEAEKMTADKADAEKMDKGDGDGDEDKDAKEKMAKDLGLAPTARISKIFAAYSAKMVPMSKLAETEKRLAVLESERAAEKQAVLEKQYSELADKGIASGYSKEKREDLIKFARADFDAAKSFVESLPGAKVFTRFTNGGNPVNTERTEGSTKMGRMNGVEVPVHGASFAEKAKAYAKQHGCDLAKAQREVLKSDPAAHADYIGQ